MEGAESKANELASGDHGGLFLTGTDLHIYNRAMANLSPVNCELDIAVKELADADALDEPAPLLRLARLRP